MPDPIEENNPEEIIFLEGAHLTLKGRALVAKLLACKGELKFTRATIGSGVIPEGKTPEEMTELAQYEMDGMIVALENPGNGEALVSIQAFPAWLEPDLITGEPVERKLDHGFFATEVALWAEDPDEGDILYDFFTLHEKPEWIRPYDSPVLKLSTFNLVTIVDTVALVSAVINPLGLATIKYVDTSLEAHALSPPGPEVHPGMYAWLLLLQQQIYDSNSQPFEADLVNLTNIRKNINDGYFDQALGAITAGSL